MRKTLTPKQRKEYDRAKSKAYRASRTPEQKRAAMDLQNKWKREKRARVRAGGPSKIVLTAEQLTERAERRAEEKRVYMRERYAKAKAAGMLSKKRATPAKPLSEALAALRVDMNLVTIAKLPS